MKISQYIEIKRLLWYTSGLILFFAPFAYYEKALSRLLNLPAAESFHYACLRIPLINLFSGRELTFLSVGFISLILLLVSAFLFGPVFCGRFCAAGALPEYLSRIIPQRFQLNWQRGVPAAPIRYGFLAGFVLAPFISSSIACSFCNYSIFELITNSVLTGQGLGVLGSTSILTALVWLLLFGFFARGGRGFCTYLCPIGAVQSVVHWLGTKFNFTAKLCFSTDRCISCGLCIKKCPTGALTGERGKKPEYQIHTCLTCRSCVDYCPHKALQFNSGSASWDKERDERVGNDSLKKIF